MAPRRYLPPLILALCTGLLLWSLGQWLWSRGIEQLGVESSAQLERFASHLDSQLGRFHFVPRLLATNRELAQAVLDADNSARIEIINRYLEEVNAIAGASVTYLMNAEGLTIAASNWRDARTFIGRNFAFRPYFKQASRGETGRYYALGTTSNKRGYYFAYPVHYAAEIVGVLVLKMNLTGIEERWSGRDTRFLVVDPDGVIFISSASNWRFRTLRALSDEARAALAQSKRYPGITFKALAISERRPVNDDTELISIRSDQGGHTLRYLDQHQAMPEAGWTIHVLSPTNGVRRDVMLGVGIGALLALLALSLIQLARQRRKRRLERERFAREAQRQLEQRVAERTAELTREIDERRHTESILRETRDELIQAAKLAVLGELSASISHELNNPLAAIRSYADNALAFLKRGASEAATENLDRISALTERMAKISSQLKVFARKSGGQIESLSLDTVVGAAVDIVRPQARGDGHKISTEALTKGLRVRADGIQLEQVFVNLLSNALHAIPNGEHGRVVVSDERLDGRILIHVDDNGPGIASEDLAQIFDPFFTTRRSGLGLGLSISQRIIENMNGTLSAANRPGSGARFTITLPTADSEHD